MMIQKLVLAAMLIFSSACGVEKNEKKEEYKYSFTDDCPTGEHVFSNMEALCQSLLNDSVNRGCAATMRIDYYRKQCDRG